MLLQRIDELHRPDHVRLDVDDECYFLREYISRVGWKAGETNNLISNLKKSPLKRGLPEWRYKTNAIQQAGKELRTAINAGWLNGAVLVPMPPSKCAGDPEYDDRMLQVAALVAQGTGALVHELLSQRTSTEAAHHQEQSRKVARLVDNLVFNEQLAATLGKPVSIGIIDDVLTTGAHFRAAKQVLAARMPGAHVVGFFVARRVLIDEDPL